MCMSIPAKVIAHLQNGIRVCVNGTERDVHVAPDVEPNGWVIISAGIAIANVSAEDAAEMQALLATARSAD